MSSHAGLEVLSGPRDESLAKRLVLESGYAGEKVVMLSPTDRPVYNQMMQALNVSMRKHFTEEEAAMRQANYPGLTRHQSLHEGFLRDYERLKQDVEGKGTDAVNALFKFVAEWVQSHITKEDKDFVDFTRQSNRPHTPRAAA